MEVAVCSVAMSSFFLNFFFCQSKVLPGCKSHGMYLCTFTPSPRQQSICCLSPICLFIFHLIISFYIYVNLCSVSLIKIIVRNSDRFSFLLQIMNQNLQLTLFIPMTLPITRRMNGCGVHLESILPASKLHLETVKMMSTPPTSWQMQQQMRKAMQTLKIPRQIPAPVSLLLLINPQEASQSTGISSEIYQCIYQSTSLALWSIQIW